MYSDNEKRVHLETIENLQPFLEYYNEINNTLYSATEYIPDAGGKTGPDVQYVCMDSRNLSSLYVEHKMLPFKLNQKQKVYEKLIDKLIVQISSQKFYLNRPVVFKLEIKKKFTEKAVEDITVNFLRKVKKTIESIFYLDDFEYTDEHVAITYSYELSEKIQDVTVKFSKNGQDFYGIPDDFDFNIILSNHDRHNDYETSVIVYSGCNICFQPTPVRRKECEVFGREFNEESYLEIAMSMKKEILEHQYKFKDKEYQKGSCIFVFTIMVDNVTRMDFQSLNADALINLFNEKYLIECSELIDSIYLHYKGIDDVDTVIKVWGT